MTGVAASVGSLARVELRRFVQHPLVLAGIVGVALLVRTMIGGDELRMAVNGLGLWPVLLLGFVVVHLAVTRDRRAGAEELASSLPVRDRNRTLAYLATVFAVALALATVWVGASLVALGGDRTMTVRTWSYSGIEWTPSVFELAQPSLVAIMIWTLAVALGRWWRHPVAAFVVPFVLFMSPVMWVAPPVVAGGLDERAGRLVEFPASAVAWHLVYLVGWIAVFAAAALLRNERRPVLAVTSVLGLAGVVAGFAFGPLPAY